MYVSLLFYSSSITVSKFFGETNLEFLPTAPGWNEKETKRKKRSLQEAIVTTGESWLVSRTKIAFGGLLKRPIFPSMYHESTIL